MGTFIIIVLISYILYYAGNIVYDLFFNKERINPEQEDKEDFSMENLTENNPIANVDIDQVETIITSQNLEVEEDVLFSSAANQNDISNNLDKLKQKYEEEKKLDDINDSKDNYDEKEEDNIGDVKSSNEESFDKTEFDKTDFIKKRKKEFKNILNLSETNVQTVYIDGEKIFKSVMFNK